MRFFIKVTLIVLFCFINIGFCEDQVKVVVIPLFSDETCTGNASSDDVLYGKTFSNANDKGITGTMPNKGPLIFTPGTANIPIDQGYYNGSGYVEGDPDLVSGNIKSGEQIFGVSGNSNVVNTSQGDAVPSDMLKDKEAYAGGNLITGTVDAGDNVTGTNGQLQVNIPSGLYSGSETAAANDANLTADNIKCGVSIFGVTGKCVYEIGDTGPAGGIVFYITPGSGGAHGLEAAPSDLSSSAIWGCGGLTITSADRTDVGTGAHNSLDIVEDCATTDTAAKRAGAYELNGYNDWFLPSIDEFNAINICPENMNFGNEYYWTSTQADIGHAWAYLGFLGYVPVLKDSIGHHLCSVTANRPILSLRQCIT